ncbi:putative carboxylesterase 15 [Hordeum vulgare]|nr:putative carboxylesterase 15 [Hordeum vulgare]
MQPRSWRCAARGAGGRAGWRGAGWRRRGGVAGVWGEVPGCGVALCGRRGGVEDCRGVLQVLSDGTTVRSAAAPYAVEDRDDGRVEWRDAVYHPAHGLGVRMYRPSRREGKGPLPLLAYFHGGGFCIGSRAWPSVHACCLRPRGRRHRPRLAPRPPHRLTPGLADGSGSDEDVCAWLAGSGADPGRLFVSGDSAGANIAHHMAARFGATGAGLGPVRTGSPPAGWSTGAPPPVAGLRVLVEDIHVLIYTFH